MTEASGSPRADRGIIHYGATLRPAKVDLIAAWLPSQRWYAGKDHVPQLVRVGGFRFEDPDGEVGIETILVADTAVEPAVVYHVPLTYRSEPVTGLSTALVGTLEHSALGTRWVYDGCHDLAYVDRLFAVISGADSCSRDNAESATGRLVDARGVVHITSAQVLTGEQSNTSVVCETSGIDGRASIPLIIKVFRTLQDGDNPDVTIQSELSRVGTPLVPTVVGDLAGPWQTPGSGVPRSGSALPTEGPSESGPGPAYGHLAFVQEFYPGVADAWRVALTAASAGVDFTDRAHALGVATAQLHRLLAERFDSSPSTAEARTDVVTRMRQRARDACTEVPSLAGFAAAADERLAGALTLPWPPLQRIHGDYHLGQVLDVPGRGWVILDFEGEPLRPLVERVRPDLPARDVAGMLRSFDYVAGSARLSQPDADISAVTGWTQNARAAFVAGYETVAGRFDEGQAEMVAVLEVDKALYEAVYESRNRPQWSDIPLRAIRSILAENKGEA